MGKPRSSTRDDFDKIKDALQKLKAENRKLRKENSSLKKELNRAQVAVFESVVDAEDENDLIVVEERIIERNCPNCKVISVLKEIKAGRYTILLCKDCGFKKRIDSSKKTV